MRSKTVFCRGLLNWDYEQLYKMYLDDGVSRDSAPKSSFLQSDDTAFNGNRALIADPEACSRYREVVITQVSFFLQKLLNPCISKVPKYRKRSRPKIIAIKRSAELISRPLGMATDQNWLLVTLGNATAWSFGTRSQIP